jgi:predicted ester cyclase
MTAGTSTALSADALRALSRRFVDEVINAHDLGAPLTELVVEDFVELNPLPGQGPGRAGLADVLAMMFAGFPDLRWNVRQTLVEDDRILSVSTWTGTNEGSFLGIPPTGRRVSVEAWTVDHYRGGQLIDSRIIMDIAGLLTQLGVLPAPAGS